MPYRTVPVRQKPWWEKVVGAWLAMGIVTGSVGLFYPAVSISGQIGTGSILYGAGMVLCGLTGTLAWIKGWRHGESVAIWVLAGLTLLHGILILMENGADGAQSAIRFLQSTLGVIAIVGLRQAFGMSRNQVRQALPKTEVLAHEVKVLHDTLDAAHNETKAAAEAATQAAREAERAAREAELLRKIMTEGDTTPGGDGRG